MSKTLLKYFVKNYYNDYYKYVAEQQTTLKNSKHKTIFECFSDINMFIDYIDFYRMTDPETNYKIKKSNIKISLLCQYSIEEIMSEFIIIFQKMEEVKNENGRRV